MVQPDSSKSAWWIKDSYSDDEIDQLVQWGLEHFWMQNHQMADLVTPGGYSIMTRGEGNYVYDIQGRKYIDGMAGLFLKNIGHRWPEIAEAVSEQMTTLAYANSGAYSTVPGILLAKKVAELAPGDLNRVFFCGGGSEAVEIATKLARQYQFITGNTSRTKIISRRGQYHGSTTTAMSIGKPRPAHARHVRTVPAQRHPGRPAILLPLSLGLSGPDQPELLYAQREVTGEHNRGRGR